MSQVLGIKDAPARRPATPHDIDLLKTIRYEDAEDGVPPIPVATLDAPRPPPRSPRRPATAPRSRASALSPDHKRDSGIAPSLSAAKRASYAESRVSSTSGGAARGPKLPTIVVQDDESPESVERSRSPLFRRRTSRQSEQVPIPQPTARLQRIPSFKGIQAEIPTGNFDDLDLQDLTSGKLGFSHRGSLMFGGQKMSDMMASQERSPVGNGIIVQPPSEVERETEVPAGVGIGKESTEPQQEVTEKPDEPPPELVTGRPKSNISMSQAAQQGNRVLSAEDVGYSTKVRTMYEYGDERAADWAQNPPNGAAERETSEQAQRQSMLPDANSKGLVVNKMRQSTGQDASLHLPTQNVRASYYSIYSKELAGGVEDWEDVQGQDVDRYGFINPTRATSGTSTVSGQGGGLQRVATALQLQANQPRRERKIRRNTSHARSTQSVLQSQSQEDKFNKAPGSMHSSHSNTPSQHRPSSFFFSKDRRALAEAADMLTLPPGLADIAEQEDAGKTASMLKRREWSRDDKWQKMARPVRERSNSLGGGMQFAFDTSDPKLISRTWKGIPDRWRATAWHCFLSTSARKRGKHASDEELITQFRILQDESCADDMQIDVDVPRTISQHIMFRRRYRGGQRLLFRVLHAISLHCPDTGYVQGMASLAATLLCYYDEEHAFIMLVRLWQLRGLEQLYRSGFDGLMAALHNFETHWLAGGAVAQQLDRLGITSTAYGTRWYLTLFSMSIPFPAQLRVWDVFMLLGDAGSAAEGKEFGGADLDVLHATSAALIDATREILLDSDFENAMKVLTSFVPVKDEDFLLRVARAEWKMRKKRAG